MKDTDALRSQYDMRPQIPSQPPNLEPLQRGDGPEQEAGAADPSRRQQRYGAAGRAAAAPRASEIGHRREQRPQGGGRADG